MLVYCILVLTSLQQQLCSGRCGARQDGILNVTVPGPLTIPCGDLLPSTDGNTVDYCNDTNSGSNLLAMGVTTLYNLTTVEPSHHNNIIYCIKNQAIFCYRLSVFCKAMCL